MNALEQRLREELRQVADRVQPDQVRPLRAPSRRRLTQRRRLWVPAVAVAAVASVVLTLMIGSGAGQITPAVSGGMPRYYVTVAGTAGQDLRAVVHESAGGRVTGSVTLPVQVLRGRTGTAGQIAAAGDDRHFAVIVYTYGDLSTLISNIRVFPLTLSADGQPRLLSAVHVSGNGDWIPGMALSPDGSRLAMSFAHIAAIDPRAVGSLHVIDMVTGTAHTWSGPAGSYWPGEPSWEDRTTVDVPWWRGLSGIDSSENVIAGVRRIDVSSAGGSLLAAPLTAFRVPVHGVDDAVVAAAGRVMIAMSCSVAANGTITARFEQLSGADGHPVWVLLTQTSTVQGLPSIAATPSVQLSPSPVTGGSSAVFPAVLCQPPSVDPSGRHVLVQALGFGRVDDGVFTRLPDPAPGAAISGTAW